MLCAAPALPGLTITNVPQNSTSAAAQNGISAATHPWMAALDLEDVSFTAGLLKEDKQKFAFPWEGTIETTKGTMFNKLPQGCKHSLNAYSNFPGKKPS